MASPDAQVEDLREGREVGDGAGRGPAGVLRKLRDDASHRREFGVLLCRVRARRCQPGGEKSADLNVGAAFG